MSETNKALVRRVVDECFNQRNMALVDELYPDCVYSSSVDGELRGEDYRRSLNAVLAAFPDGQWTVDDQVAEGERVVTRWTLTGTHQANLRAIGATGKRLTVSGVWIERIRDGVVAEKWEKWDDLNLLIQLGVVQRVPHGSRLRPIHGLVLGLTALCILLITILCIGVYHRLNADTAARENWERFPLVDTDSVAEEGEIERERREVDWDAWLFENPSRNIHWWVRVPSTKTEYVCHWGKGYSGFHRGDTVTIIHPKDEPVGFFEGFIVGLQGDKKDRAAGVSGIDVEME